MQPRIYLFAASALLFLAGCNAVTEKEQSAKDRSQGSYPTDDLYLEDQDASLEGSGRGGGEVRDDLEASGSGLGPDDEDGDGGSSVDTEYNNHHKPIEPTSPKPVEPRITHTDDTDIKVKETNKETATRPEYIDVVETHGGNYHESDSDIREVHIMNPKHEDRASSFFAQPGVLAAVIGGAVVGLLCAILVVMFIVYRMRKKDEGSYALDEPRRSPATQTYPKPGAPHHNREFYA